MRGCLECVGCENQNAGGRPAPASFPLKCSGCASRCVSGTKAERRLRARALRTRVQPVPTSARQWFTPSRPRELTAVLGILARPRPSAASYCHCDDASDALSCLYEVPVAQVRVARRGPVSAMPEESADERQTFARHNGLTGGGMSQVMQPEPAEHCIGTNRPPAGCKAVGAPAFGVERGHERIGVRAPGSAAVCARAALPSGTVCGPVLASGRLMASPPTSRRRRSSTSLRRHPVCASSWTAATASGHRAS